MPLAVARFLEGWATPEGTARDVATGFPLRIRRTTDSMVMVLIPAGSFLMGAVPFGFEPYDDELPRHEVRLSKAYYLDEHEVTVRMWNDYVASGRGRGNSADLVQPDATSASPMHNVSWEDAQGYVKWVRAALPTEAQWERAAKGGNDGFVYPWGESDDDGNRNGRGDADGFPGLAPVKSFAANPYGLFEMSGNVIEWCADGYGHDYYERSPALDPTGIDASPKRVARGGGWRSYSFFLRASLRHGFLPYRHEEIGFRCAKVLP